MPLAKNETTPKKSFVQAKMTFDSVQFSPDATPAIAQIAKGLSLLCDDLDTEFKKVQWSLWNLSHPMVVETKGGGV